MQARSDYNIIEELYSTEKIHIYRGIRISDKQSIILKVLSNTSDQEDVAHLKYEFNLIKNLNLPRIIHAYGLEEDEQSCSLVLEDIPEGLTLGQFLLGAQLPIDRFLFLAIELAQALIELHSAHIIHKDINPNNIIISRKNHAIKLIDFSIATQLSQEVLETKSPEELEGTLAYMSPEQTSRMNRVVDERSDLYSLGVTFFEMLTGQLPFEANDVKVNHVKNHVKNNNNEYGLSVAKEIKTKWGLEQEFYPLNDHEYVFINSQLLQDLKKKAKRYPFAAQDLQQLCQSKTKIEGSSQGKNGFIIKESGFNRKIPSDPDKTMQIKGKIHTRNYRFFGFLAQKQGQVKIYEIFGFLTNHKKRGSLSLAKSDKPVDKTIQPVVNTYGFRKG